MSRAGRQDDPLVRPYVVTNGRSQPSRNTFDVITLVALAPGAAALRQHRHLSPEHRMIIDFLSRSAQSVAELGALVRQPLIAVRILLSDLLEEGLITTRQRITESTAGTNRELLEAVLAGLQRL